MIITRYNVEENPQAYPIHVESEAGKEFIGHFVQEIHGVPFVECQLGGGQVLRFSSTWQEIMQCLNSPMNGPAAALKV